MNVTPILGLLCAALLVGCEKSGEREKSAPADAAMRESSRTKRAERAAASASSHQIFRDTLAAALALDPSEARDQALAELVRNAVELDPDIAAKAFAALSVDSPQRMTTLSYLAIYFARKDPTEALAWAASLGSPAEIAAAKGEIAVVVAETDPASAIKTLLGSGTPKGELDETMMDVIRQWAGKSPNDAATWALSLPPGEARRAGLETVAAQWLQSNATAAFAWLAEPANRAVRKEALRAMAQALVDLPGPISENLMGYADASIRGDLEQQVKQITEQAAKDAPPAVERPEPPAE